MINDRIPREEGELIKQGPDIEIRPSINSIDDLFESGIIGEFVKNSGQCVILPKGTRLLNGIYVLLEEYLKIPLNFEEVVLPKIAPVDTFRKAGILSKWDDYLISAKPFSRTNGVGEEYLMVVELSF